jgi:predicted ATPase/class 3 adenylate cyclase/tetratricopeptide (TPR) repeat protein
VPVDTVRGTGDHRLVDARLPTGVVTFLFTDVEGSTKLLHELGDEYAAALQEHRRILRGAFDAHDGVEVDTQGDAFFVAFARASAGVASATQAQQALAGGPIKVRMGLHSGEPRLTEEGYVGLDVHKGARIAAVGHGGQVLLSEATHTLVDAQVRDLGPHRLKDLTAPERIYQLEIEGLRSDFPLLKTLDAGLTNLPSPRTSFVGRGDELEEIDRLLEDPNCRLLTLVGPGGVGKTRLALEAAARRIDRYAHGVHFVPLASVVAPDFLAPAVADALQFPIDTAHSGLSPQDQLVDYLSERSTLLVLDNFEHLVEGAGLVTLVIERASNVRILTTSRERLNVQSEWVLDVDGLRVSANGNGHERAEGALRLFEERARQVDHGFELGEAELKHAVRICRLVDGMPLGIELAAAWVSMLPCAEIADEIERTIGFLETSMRDVPERHRSLRAAFDHSWRLLTDEQRRCFRQLSVFRGPFTREAAAVVAGADLGLLAELVSKSLVRRLELGRYELHELLRQYAVDRLAEDPDEPAEVRERHARFYVGRLVDRREALPGPRMSEARDELRGDVPNLGSAGEWAATQWPEDDALSAFHALYWVHSWPEGLETFEHLAELAGYTPATTFDAQAASSVLLGALAGQVCFASYVGYDEAQDALARTCTPELRARGLAEELGLCLLALGTNACYIDDYPAAVTLLEESAAVNRSAGDQWSEAVALSWLGFATLLQNELDAARTAFEASYQVALDMGQPLMLAFALSKLGLLADASGDYREAMRLHTEANGSFEAVGDRGGAGYALSRASVSAYCLGDYEEALRLGRAGHDAFADVNHRWGMIGAACRVGFALVALGDGGGARERFRWALEQAQATEAKSLALLALSGVGVLLAQEGEEGRAAELLTFVFGYPGYPPFYFITSRPELDRLEAELAPDELTAAREAAQTADFDAVVATAEQVLAGVIPAPRI